MNDGPVGDGQFHTSADGAKASQGVSGHALLVELIDRIPTAEEHKLLFQSVGWPEYEVKELEKALRGSLAGTVAKSEREILAMGRIVGDGGKFFYVQDLVVVPHRQGQGIGRMVLDRLISQVENVAVGTPYIGVFATPEAIELYRRFGFKEGFGGLIGMAKAGQHHEG